LRVSGGVQSEGGGVGEEMRTPLLEELYEQVTLNAQKMNAQTAALLKGYVPPPTLGHVETSLASEFGPLCNNYGSGIDDAFDPDHKGTFGIAPPGN